jgi:hypothetical protein
VSGPDRLAQGQVTSYGPRTYSVARPADLGRASDSFATTIALEVSVMAEQLEDEAAGEREGGGV